MRNEEEDRSTLGKDKREIDKEREKAEKERDEKEGWNETHLHVWGRVGSA